MQARQPASASAAAEHRSKRKFQPSITSYFALRDAFDDDQHLQGLDPTARPRQLHHHTRTPHHPHRETLAPVLPGHVQADLLNVGMRVRKSVPEGYKTHKMAALPCITTTASNSPTLDVKPPQDHVPLDFAHQRELLPFCGLHKVAGYAEQPTTNLHLYGGVDTHGQRTTNMFPLPAAAFSQPFSSQGSTDSGYSSASQRPANSMKRSWSDDEEAPLNTNFFFAIPTKGISVDIDEVPISPLSETPPRSINMLPQVRHFAQPKSRRRATADEDMDMDFGNSTQLEASLSAGSGSDFEEADFLAREVDMGGI
ncbi:hypothetical protein ACN47E_006537 [Coniothyrium glycines]